MPILTQIFQDTYGWRGASLLLFGVNLHGVVCAVLFKPVGKENYAQLPADDLDFSDNIDNLKKFDLRNAIQRCASLMRRYLDVSTLFSNFSFIAMMFLFAGDGFYTTGWLIYVVPHALDIDLTSSEASLVATAGGVGSLIGNCLFPLTSKIMSNKAQLYVSICIIAASLASDVVASIFVSYVGMIICSSVYGLGRGIMATALYANLNDIYKDDIIVNAMAWLYAVYGLTSVFAGYFCGKH